MAAGKPDFGFAGWRQLRVGELAVRPDAGERHSSRECCDRLGSSNSPERLSAGAGRYGLRWKNRLSQFRL